MKTKLSIMALFAIATGICYVLFKEEPQFTPKEAIKPIDTVEVVAKYLVLYDDSCKTAMRCCWETERTADFEAHKNEYERLSARYDALIEKAGKNISQNKFNLIIERVIDND